MHHHHRGLDPDFVVSELLRHISEGKFYCLVGNDELGAGFKVDGFIRRRYDAMVGMRCDWMRCDVIG